MQLCNRGSHNSHQDLVCPKLFLLNVPKSLNNISVPSTKREDWVEVVRHGCSVLNSLAGN